MAITLVFGTINAVEVLRVPSVMRAYGFPTAFFVEGGCFGVKKFIASGVLIDLGVLIALAGAVSWAWTKFSERTLSHTLNP
jgi:hypothetical protein